MNKLVIELKKKLPQLFNLLFEQQIQLVLVGGACRDFFNNKLISTDLDFEMHSFKEISSAKWIEKISQVAKEIEKNLKVKVEYLPYEILRFDYNGFQIELASPRVEEFLTNISSYGHKNFIGHPQSKGNFEELWARRDFTMNAIGISFAKEGANIIDPFGGINDLENNTLEFISDKFFYDPVRFLRAFRFRNVLGMRFSEKLDKNFKKFNLSELSLFYFFKEIFKGDFREIIEEMKEYINKNKIVLSRELSLIIQNKLRGDYSSVTSVNEYAYYLILEGSKEGLSIVDMLINNSFLAKKNIERIKVLVNLMNNFNGEVISKVSSEFKKMTYKDGLEIFSEEIKDISNLLSKFSKCSKELLNFLPFENKYEKKIDLIVTLINHERLVNHETIEKIIEDEHLEIQDFNFVKVLKVIREDEL